MKDKPKSFFEMAIDVRVRLIIGGVCFLIALLDGAMRQCEQSYEEFFQCLSFVGRSSVWIIAIILASFVIQNMLWPALKWIIDSVNKPRTFL